MPPLRGLRFVGFGSKKIPLLTELENELPQAKFKVLEDNLATA